MLGRKHKGVSVINKPKANSSKGINVGKKPLQIAIGGLKKQTNKKFLLSLATSLTVKVINCDLVTNSNF